MSYLPSYYKSEEEMQFVERVIDQDVFSLANEFQELYTAKNECWFEDVVNLFDGTFTTLNISGISVPPIF